MTESSLGLGLSSGQFLDFAGGEGMSYKGKRNLKSKLYCSNSPGLQFHWTPVRVRGSGQELILQGDQGSK